VWQASAKADGKFEIIFKPSKASPE